MAELVQRAVWSATAFVLLAGALLAMQAASASEETWALLKKPGHQSVNQKILANRSIYPDEATFARLYTVTPYPQDVQRIVTRIWTRVKSGR